MKGYATGDFPFRYWPSEYGDREPPPRRRLGIRAEGDNTGEIGVGSYADTGCPVSPKCTECPLAKCREDFGSSNSAPGRLLDLAIEHSWALGIRHPNMLRAYKGRRDRVPADVLE